MKRWLFLPDDAVNELALLASLDVTGVQRIVEILDSEEVRHDPPQSLQIAEALGISDQAAAEMYGLWDYVRDEQMRHRKGDADVIKEFEHFLKRRIGRSEGEDKENVERTLKSIQKNKKSFESLFGNLPKRAYGEKVRRLMGGPLPHLHELSTYCDLRPIYNKEGTQILEYIPIITLRLLSHTRHDAYKEVIVQLTENDLPFIREQFQRLDRKLKALKEDSPSFSAAKRGKGHAE